MKLILAVAYGTASGYNINVDDPIKLSPDLTGDKDLFGYSTAAGSNDILIGAPKANGVGALWKCDFDGNCQDYTKRDNNQTEFGFFGASVDRKNRELLVCDPFFSETRLAEGDTPYYGGMCYEGNVNRLDRLTEINNHGNNKGLLEETCLVQILYKIRVPNPN